MHTTCYRFLEGLHTVGPRSVGSRSVGPRTVGPRTVGPRSVGPRSVGLFLTLCLSVILFTGAMPAHGQSLQGADLNNLVDEAATADLLQQSGREPQVGNRAVTSAGNPRPFGANLFDGGFSNDREDGLNPGYIIQPGDQVAVRVWGAIEFNESLTVDARGNIFIPKVGPVLVGGVPNRDLNKRVTRSVRSVFTDNVRVYTSLNGSQPVAVFVTGYVAQPGRFSGIPSNSALHFIDRAGGIDEARGSYRNISVMRDGKALAHIDLYDFLLSGILPVLQFQDGDTIVVGVRNSAVEVTGDVGNVATFELAQSTASGAELIQQALLKPGVSYAAVSGIRKGKPFSIYLPVAEFEDFRLQDGDLVNFSADQHDTVIVVEVEGSHLGPSRYAVPRDTRLQEVLDYIEVDPVLADVGALSLRRQSVALRQKQSLEESLRRLESRYLTASSQTDAEARIRSQEAQLVSQFVQRAREVEPSGRLVVASGGQVADILLQQGDTISIPRRSDSVLLSGEVFVTQAMLYSQGRRARDYIEMAGGFTQQALKDRLVVVHANGQVTTDRNPRIRPGDEIIVMPRVPTKNLQLASILADILYKVAIATSVALKI
ncbi:MAG: polysaccharide export protein [Granulosicoccus sp.]|nr:polysaccharide export protein [Granulosicoccus sp.]